MENLFETKCFGFQKRDRQIGEDNKISCNAMFGGKSTNFKCDKTLFIDSIGEETYPNTFYNPNQIHCKTKSNFIFNGLDPNKVHDQNDVYIISNTNCGSNYTPSRVIERTYFNKDNYRKQFDDPCPLARSYAYINVEYDDNGV